MVVWLQAAQDAGSETVGQSGTELEAELSCLLEAGLDAMEMNSGFGSASCEVEAVRIASFVLL